MLIDFFRQVKAEGIPVSINELLLLLEALSERVVSLDAEQFYSLSRTVLVKDEKYYDKFDRAFSRYFSTFEENLSVEELLEKLIPEDWLKNEFIKSLSEDEKKKIDSLESLDKLLETFKRRLEEQKKRHQGGSKWLGTGGTSPFGNSGYHPEGVRVGGEGQHGRAAKVWEQRKFKNLDDSVELGTRNIKVALRKLRKFARSGAADQLDITGTIRSTADNAGYLDLKMVPERHNAVKVLLFFDVGGSMDPYVDLCEELFSACRGEFKHMEYFYFHNFIYESVWRDNFRRGSERVDTLDILHQYGRDYKIIFVGDASMAPYEIVSQFGSVEHMNAEPGQVWMQRVLDTFDKIMWLNPVQKNYWEYTQTIGITKKMLDGNMYPLTIEGLDAGIKHLSK